MNASLPTAERREARPPSAPPDRTLADPDAFCPRFYSTLKRIARWHLAPVDARLCRLVQCRFFTALTGPELASALGVTDRTVRRDWHRAKAWLYRELTA